MANWNDSSTRTFHMSWPMWQKLKMLLASKWQKPWWLWSTRSFPVFQVEWQSWVHCMFRTPHLTVELQFQSLLAKTYRRSSSLELFFSHVPHFFIADEIQWEQLGWTRKFYIPGRGLYIREQGASETNHGPMSYGGWAPWSKRTAEPLTGRWTSRWPLANISDRSLAVHQCNKLLPNVYQGVWGDWGEASLLGKYRGVAVCNLTGECCENCLKIACPDPFQTYVLLLCKS